MPLHPVFRDSLRRLFRNVDPVRTSAEEWQWEVIGRVLDGHIDQMVDKVMDGSASLASTSPVIVNATLCPILRSRHLLFCRHPQEKHRYERHRAKLDKRHPTPLASPKSLAIMQEIIDRARELGMAPLSGEQLFALMKGEMASVNNGRRKPSHPSTGQTTASVTFAGVDLDSDTSDDGPRPGATSTQPFAQTEVFMRIEPCTPQDRIHPHARPPEHQHPTSDEYHDPEPDPIHLHARPPERDHSTPSMYHDYEPDRIHLHARPPEDGYPIPTTSTTPSLTTTIPPMTISTTGTHPRPVYDSEDDYEMGVESNLRDAYEEGYEERYEDGSAADYADSRVYESSEDASDLSELDEPHGYSGNEDYGDDGSASGEHSHYDSDE
ncbi:hypothetical protein D9611_014812 [Ephemerocybe angulata]|uniref:Uncharacterized protein n=1 Tax=Ephemerocybe angulata TaxID=980116 RepID=A0A8H5CAT2_9AGAR|nr:hypothetical protein D9611_014812 [Tulosesus angulatus]